MTIKVRYKHLKKVAPELVPDHYKGRDANENWAIDIPNAHQLPKKLIDELYELTRNDYKAKIPGADAMQIALADNYE